ncbi:hypothetical protein HDU76_007357, partial [Blyttiomyces sp. JEL0837]
MSTVTSRSTRASKNEMMSMTGNGGGLVKASMKSVAAVEHDADTDVEEDFELLDSKVLLAGGGKKRLPLVSKSVAQVIAPNSTNSIDNNNNISKDFDTAKETTATTTSTRKNKIKKRTTAAGNTVAVAVQQGDENNIQGEQQDPSIMQDENTSRTVNAPWTEEEDLKLKEGLARCGPNYKEIKRLFNGNRTSAEASEIGGKLILTPDLYLTDGTHITPNWPDRIAIHELVGQNSQPTAQVAVEPASTQESQPLPTFVTIDRPKTKKKKKVAEVTTAESATVTTEELEEQVPEVQPAKKSTSSKTKTKVKKVAASSATVELESTTEPEQLAPTTTSTMTMDESNSTAMKDPPATSTAVVAPAAEPTQTEVSEPKPTTRKTSTRFKSVVPPTTTPAATTLNAPPKLPLPDLPPLDNPVKKQVKSLEAQNRRAQKNISNNTMLMDPTLTPSRKAAVRARRVTMELEHGIGAGDFIEGKGKAKRGGSSGKDIFESVAMSPTLKEAVKAKRVTGAKDVHEKIERSLGGGSGGGNGSVGDRHVSFGGVVEGNSGVSMDVEEMVQNRIVATSDDEKHVEERTIAGVASGAIGFAKARENFTPRKSVVAHALKEHAMEEGGRAQRRGGTVAGGRISKLGEEVIFGSGEVKVEDGEPAHKEVEAPSESGKSDTSVAPGEAEENPVVLTPRRSTRLRSKVVETDNGLPPAQPNFGSLGLKKKSSMEMSVDASDLANVES